MSESSDEKKRLASIKEQEEISAFAKQLLEEQKESGQPFKAVDILSEMQRRKKQAVKIANAKALESKKPSKK